MKFSCAEHFSTARCYPVHVIKSIALRCVIRCVLCVVCCALSVVRCICAVVQHIQEHCFGLYPCVRALCCVRVCCCQYSSCHVQRL